MSSKKPFDSVIFEKVGTDSTSELGVNTQFDESLETKDGIIELQTFEKNEKTEKPSIQLNEDSNNLMEPKTSFLAKFQTKRATRILGGLGLILASFSFSMMGVCVKIAGSKYGSLFFFFHADSIMNQTSLIGH